MRVEDLDYLDYRSAWQAQERAHAEVAAGGEERVLLVEHPPVITFGRRAQESASHLIANESQLRTLGVQVVESDRGGDITFHGPGQVVAYPIIRLADRQLSVGGYMKLLQQGVIDTVQRFGVEGRLDPEAVGVWVDGPDGNAAKLCAFGVRVRRGVTLHGLALNVETDLRYFDLIVPCGLAGRPVTSLRKLLGPRAPSMQAVKLMLAACLRKRLTTEANAQHPTSSADS